MTTLDQLEYLLRAENIQQLYNLASEVTKELGFEDFLHGMRNATSLTEPARFDLRGSHTAWQDHYRNKGYERIDPVINHCSRHNVPVTWDDQLFVKPQAVKMYREAKEFGLVNSVTFPIHGPRVDVALLTLVSQRPLSEAPSGVAMILAQGHLFACYFQEAVQRLLNVGDISPGEPKMLTHREKQCLLWAALGKTSWEIAQILNVSERTTVFHFSNAAKKLGAVNRRQAVVRAIALGFINP